MAKEPAGRDYARGARGALLWGAPIGLILVATALGSAGVVTYLQGAELLAAGTTWFGLTCLVNALRCGRVHCWIDGTVLPAWAVVVAVEGIAPVRLSLNTLSQVVWGVVLLSFVVEWIAGPYPFRSSRPKIEP
jgi:hypothetical protein